MTTIDARYAFWLAPFMSTEEVRYYINGIYIEPCPKGGALLIATDGHVMGIVHDETAVVEKGVIWKPSKDLLAAGKTANKKDDPCVLSLSARDGAPIDGTFPDWRRVIRGPGEVKASQCLSLNPDLLKKFANALDGKGVNIQPTGPSDPIIVTSPGRPNFYGLVMPMRVEEPDKKLPTWMGVKPRVRVKALKAAA
jgi:hypothetical protein